MEGTNMSEHKDKSKKDNRINEPSCSPRDGEMGDVEIPEANLNNSEQQHEEVQPGRCVCTCDCCEESDQLDLCAQPACVCFYGSFEESDHMCCCGEEHCESGVYFDIHCCDCGVQLAVGKPEERTDGDRKPFPEFLPGNASEEPINAPPPPPPMPPRTEDPRMTFKNTAETPMTLFKSLACDDGGPCDTRLHEAARAGNVSKLISLLDNENLFTNINNKMKPFMSTPLREAVAGGCLQCVKELLKRKVDVDVVDVKAQTPLFYAASLGLPDIMEELLRFGACPEGSPHNTCSPLLLCVREGCVEGVKVLLKYNVDPQPVSMLTTCVPGWPLQHSLVYRHYTIFVALLRGGAKTSLLETLQNKHQKQPEVIDASIVNRLSITRSALRHAKDMPEFLLAYREFGGRLEKIQDISWDLCSQESPALNMLQYCLDNPMTLRSQCRLKIFRTVGPHQLRSFISSVCLPASLSSFISFENM